jgi:hypothetical protein
MSDIKIYEYSPQIHKVEIMGVKEIERIDVEAFYCYLYSEMQYI